VKKPHNMTKPTLLLAVSFSCLFSYGQKTDTLVLFYQPGKFNLSHTDRQKLDGFILRQWDKISINGYTDDTEDEEYNLELSKKRSQSVYEYCTTKNSSNSYVSFLYFGEAMPRVDNNSGVNRSLNRRTEIIGYHFPNRPPINFSADPMTPVTQTLDNGLIITYRPGSLPANFDEQLANNLQLVTNTIEMRQYNLYNNTTRGEILSSVMIVCGGQVNPCKLDSPILVKVPIPDEVVCPIEKVKFFNSTLEKGKGVWQEQNKLLYPEVIGGKKYIRLLLDDLCSCVNFDFKVDPDCFETDSAHLLLTNATIKNFYAELKGLNSVYLPRRINDSIYGLLYIKNKIGGAGITFTLYDGKRRIKTFRDQPLSVFPYDETSNRYKISLTSLRIYFPRLRVTDVMLKVNKDKYRVAPEKKQYEFVYLNRKTEKIKVDFTIVVPGGRVVEYRDQPIESIPYDESKGYRVINKQFLKELSSKEAQSGVKRETDRLVKQ
jgi:OmpA family